MAKTGRPKGDKSFAAMLRIAINEASANGGTKLRDVADTLVKEAISGNVQAISIIADRLDGKPVQAIHHGGDEENPLVGEIVYRVIDPRSTGSP